jgi:hypothetical protein
VSVKLTNASDLHRACARLSTELAQLHEITDELFTSILRRTDWKSVSKVPQLHSRRKSRTAEHSRNWLLTWEDARGYDRLSQPRNLLTGTRANERDPDSLNSMLQPA